MRPSTKPAARDDVVQLVEAAADDALQDARIDRFDDLVVHVECATQPRVRGSRRIAAAPEARADTRHQQRSYGTTRIVPSCK